MLKFLEKITLINDPILFQNRALCHECNAKVKAVGLGKYMCNKCQ